MPDIDRKRYNIVFVRWALLSLIFALLSCGTNTILSEKPSFTYIQNLRVINNVLSFDTPDSTFVSITSLDFEAWSAGSKPSRNHIYQLPVIPGNPYHLKIQVETKDASATKDTTFTFTATDIAPSLLRVHFINVQQGDAILIQTPDGKNLKIDGGYGSRGNTQAWSGARVPLALNYLRENNVTHIDYMIESHRHLDHYGGLDDIRNSDITIAHILSNSNNPRSYRPGDKLTIDTDADFYIYNIGYPLGYTGSDINDTSIVMRLVYGDAAFLFTGDATGHVQDWLYSQNYDISVDVLKVSHHGARTHNTTDQEFLDRTLDRYCKVAILSFGEGNPYGHPASMNRFSPFQTFGTNHLSPTSGPPSGQNGGKFRFGTGTVLVQTDGKMIFVSTENIVN
jgi:beta-lactamase superfamily II metal-dependent hydrolase